MRATATSVAKGRLGKNVYPLINGMGALVMKSTGKVELLNGFFASVFTAEASSPQESHTLETKDKVWREFPVVIDHLSKHDVYPCTPIGCSYEC